MRSDPDRALMVAQLFSRRDRENAEARLARCVAEQQAAQVAHGLAVDAQAEADRARRAPRAARDVRGFDAEQRARARAYAQVSRAVEEAALRRTVAAERVAEARAALAEVWARDEAIRRTRERRATMRTLARRRRGEDADAARE